MSEAAHTSLPTDASKAVIERSIDINATPEVIFDAILQDMASIVDGQGKVMKFVLEAFPGGRWYRDLGNNAGHFWGHVQVIKPPTLIEVYGPLMVSSAAISHVAYRVTSDNGVNRLKITHKIFGDFDPKLPGMVGSGWQQCVDRVKALALSRAPSQAQR